jgi:hypothetical protein
VFYDGASPRDVGGVAGVSHRKGAAGFTRFQIYSDSIHQSGLLAQIPVQTRGIKPAAST